MANKNNPRRRAETAREGKFPDQTETEILAAHLTGVAVQLLARLSVEDRCKFLLRKIFEVEPDETKH